MRRVVWTQLQNTTAVEYTCVLIGRTPIIISVIIAVGFFGCTEDEPEYSGNEEDLIQSAMVLIPAGEFEMGGDDGYYEDYKSRPIHTVYLDAFYIDKYEVTNAQYAQFLNEYGKNSDSTGRELAGIGFSGCLLRKIPVIGGWVYDPEPGFEDHPVLAVTWFGAAAYAQFYRKRLPTEAQWEKAARGGLVGKKYPWGDEMTHNDANYKGADGRDVWDGIEVSPVGSFPPNRYGLYDIIGNVQEWCADIYDNDYYKVSPKLNPTGPGIAVKFENDDFFATIDDGNMERVVRGGSIFYNYPRDLRVSIRGGEVPLIGEYCTGFRCVK